MQSENGSNKPSAGDTPSKVNRRTVLKATAAAVPAIPALANLTTSQATAQLQEDSDDHLLPEQTMINFPGKRSRFHGHQWETLNPGYWEIKEHALYRRFKNVGDRARSTGFPFHAATHGREFKTDYDPSLKPAAIYSRQWKLKERYRISGNFTYLGRGGPNYKKEDNAKWKMYQKGYGQMGVVIGAKNLHESFNRFRNAIRIVWSDDKKLSLIIPGKNKRDEFVKSVDAPSLQPGDNCRMIVSVVPAKSESDEVTEHEILVSFETPSRNVKLSHKLRVTPVDPTAGFCGITCRGRVNFRVNYLNVNPLDIRALKVGVTDCLTCYPLGDTLRKEGDQWKVRFIAMFASSGKQAMIRIADSPNPEGGWKKVRVAGLAPIKTNDFRINTAVLDTWLPVDPSTATLYYTVWKDDVNVTADYRIGTDACGPGTGFVGDVPVSGNYVGRLPQLKAPYKLCGLSCHAIHQGLQQKAKDGSWVMSGGNDDWLVRDQPTVDAFKHLEDYNFQVLVWEDDVWYMELLMYPPSTDDAYKIVTHTLCGPTTRWQMMRHWNVINPGDHDYGMDDVKGPEQLVIRNVKGLGQDIEYMRRNFQIVHHLTTGAEEVDGKTNPKKWRGWKMPNRDFTLIVCDSRLWRSSQDVDIWDDDGWQEFKSLYGRTDPTRSLLGEEQFSWLEEQLATDSSPLICLTGINGLHTIWAGANGPKASGKHPKKFSERDRVVADYAGWVKAGADRVLQLLGSRSGIVSVYGDVHNGCIMTNQTERVIECSFGPIGRTGGRAVIPGFGPSMKDVDDRPLHIHALYHRQFANPKLEKHGKGQPVYWNFLEMQFDPSQADPSIDLRIRNLLDQPTDTPRGGGSLSTTASQTGRYPLSKLGTFRTLPNADVRFTDSEGKPLFATRSNSEGHVFELGMIDSPTDTPVIMTAFDGTNSESRVLKTRY